MTYEKYFKAMLVIIGIWLVFDGVTTWFVFSKLGHHQAELNPIMRFLMDKIGFEASLILTRVLYLVPLQFLYHPLKDGGKLELALMVFLLLFVFALTINNTIAVLKVLFL